MSKDKYPCIFLKTNETTVFIIVQIFFAQSRARDLLICQRQSCQSLIGFQNSDVFQFEQIFFSVQEKIRSN